MAATLFEAAQAQMERTPEPRLFFAQQPTYCSECGLSAGDHTRDCSQGEEFQRRTALQESFAEALTGDLAAPAVFAQRVTWLTTATVADVLADAISDNQDLLRRAMAILANAAAGRGTQRDAQQLLEQAVGEWAESNAS